MREYRGGTVCIEESARAFRILVQLGIYQMWRQGLVSAWFRCSVQIEWVVSRTNIRPLHSNQLVTNRYCSYQPALCGHSKICGVIFASTGKDDRKHRIRT